eukprot:TRINITY_DN78180_c0_g1_i1.p2 TRINITY_DN78180_c0_g1~~TRINITY_DN78180_c0_g1_i1.p2  ORF type:complete len:239 (-),score=22.23 TRINITY_DN78180_c0_g1_i1:283-999(-)
MKGHGLRARTRDMFSRGFRQKGYIPLTTYLRTYRLGDHVDIKVNAAVQKGMPFKFYQGKTGRVWNVTKRAVGVEVNKRVNTRIVRKRIHVRIEHITPSRCDEDFKARVKANEARKKATAEAKAAAGGVKTKSVATKPVVPEALKGLPLDVGPISLNFLLALDERNKRPKKSEAQIAAARAADKAKRDAKFAEGPVVSSEPPVKRKPAGPRPGFLVPGMTMETVTPIPYDVVNDLKGGY